MASVLTGPPNPAPRVSADATAGGRLPAFARHPVGLALASATLLWLAFPPVGWHGAAWVALVPLFLMVADPRPRKVIGLAAWLSARARLQDDAHEHPRPMNWPRPGHPGVAALGRTSSR